MARSNGSDATKKGSKGKYAEWLTSDGLTKLEAWARDGLTDEQIAQKMNIAYSTLRDWRDKYSALSAALKRGKEVIDIEVENKLLQRAKGYKYTEVTKELVVVRDKYGAPLEDADGAVVRELQVTKEVIKEVQPDTTAQIFWLKNRKPKEWRDRIETVNENLNTDLTQLSAEERAKRIEELINKNKNGN